MSSSSNEEHPNQELDQMRERIRQYQEQESQTAQLNRDLQQKVDEFEMEQQIRSSLQSPLSSLPALDRLRELNSPYRKQVSEIAQLNTELQMKNDELVRQRNRLLKLQELQEQEFDSPNGRTLS